MALSIGLDTAVQALRAQQLAVDTASHNVANAQSPGFSRQRVLLRPVGITGSDFRFRDALLGKTGFGVDAHDVERLRDVFLDFQSRQAAGTKAQYTQLSNALQQTQVAFNEPSDNGLGELFGAFWGAWQDVANDPESSASRTTLVNASTTLTTRIQRASQSLVQQRQDLDSLVAAEADKINAASTDIAQLNLQIKQVELAGDKANDLRDRRDMLVDQLATYAQITYTEQPDHTLTINLGDHELVTGNTARAVQSVPDNANPGMSKLTFVMDDAVVTSSTGELRGLIDARDAAIPGVQAKLNALASQLITSVNAVHSAGFGLDGSTTLPFFTGSDASDIAVNATLVASPDKVAAGAAAGTPGDGSVALQIANLQQAATMASGTVTFDQYYADMVSVLGADTNRAQGMQDSSSLTSDHIEGMRQAVSGVNIDEEMTNLNAAQHAYDAAARIITTIDSMLDTLINNTGVVGR